jgi:hypothetical protein
MTAQAAQAADSWNILTFVIQDQETSLQEDGGFRGILYAKNRPRGVVLTR